MTESDNGEGWKGVVVGERGLNLLEFLALQLGVPDELHANTRDGDERVGLAAKSNGYVLRVKLACDSLEQMAGGCATYEGDAAISEASRRLVVPVIVEHARGRLPIAQIGRVQPKAILQKSLATAWVIDIWANRIRKHVEASKRRDENLPTV